MPCVALAHISQVNLHFAPFVSANSAINHILQNLGNLLFSVLPRSSSWGWNNKSAHSLCKPSRASLSFETFCGLPARRPPPDFESPTDPLIIALSSSDFSMFGNCLLFVV